MIDMHVLVIGRGIPSDTYPTYGIFEYGQAKALSKKIDKVSYFAIDLRSLKRKRRFGIYHGKDGKLDWYVFSFPLGAVPDWIFDLFGFFALVILNQLFLSHRKPTIVHSHFISHSFSAALFCRLYKYCYVHTEHSSLMNSCKLNNHNYRVAKYSYNMAQCVIAVSDALAANIYNNFKIQSIVVPNMLSPEFEHYNYCQHNGFGFIFVGNLIENKHPKEILEVFDLLNRKYPQTYLGIVGDGKLYPAIKRYVDNNNLDKCVTLYGQINREELVSIYNHHDCLVLFSDSETFGVVCIEAMSQGLPVITSSSGGPDSFISSDVGCIIPTNDKDALFRAMEDIFVNYHYDREQIRDYTLSTYSSDAVTSKLISIYDSINSKNDR